MAIARLQVKSLPKVALARPKQPAPAKTPLNGTRLWHRWFFNPDGSLRDPEYQRFFLTLESHHHIATQDRLKQIRSLIKQGNSESGLKEWQDMLSKTVKPEFVFESVGSNYWASKLSAQPIRVVLLQILEMIFKDGSSNEKTNMSGFIQFIEPLSQSPLVVEVIPEFIKYLCLHKDVALAQTVLIELSNSSIRGDMVGNHSLFDEGLVRGLNELLYFYSASTQRRNRGLSKYWSDMYEVLVRFNPEIGLKMHTSVMHKLNQRVPRTSYLAFFELLRQRGVKFTEPEHQVFVRAVFDSSEVAKKVVGAAAMDGVGLPSENGSENRPAYSREFFRFLLRKYSRDKDSARTAWLLERVVLWGKSDPETLTKQDWALMIYRALEIDDVSAARAVYRVMIDHGISPTKEMMLTIFRGFRLAGMEDRCVHVLKLVKAQWRLSAAFGTEVLALLSAKYPCAVVLEHFALLFPSNRQYLAELGIESYAQPSSVIGGTAPDLGISSKDVEDMRQTWQGPLICEPALNIVYSSVLNSVGGHQMDEFLRLFDQYRRFVSQRHSQLSTISLRVLDMFVVNLCDRIGTDEAVAMAHDLFMKATKSLPFRSSRRAQKKCISLGILARHHIRRHNIDRVLELVTAVETCLFLPATPYLYGPLITHYRRTGRPDLAQQWTKYAEDMGAIVPEAITDD